MDTGLLKHDNPQLLVELIKRLFAEINTAIPGKIIAFNKVKQQATVRPSLRSVFIGQDGEKKQIDLPQILNCPVFFPYSAGSGFSLTYPVQEGDDCLLVFSQRSFDAWLEHGGIQNAAAGADRPRVLDYNDAIVLVGLIPKPFAITDFQDDGIEIRNKARTSFLKVADASIHQKSPAITVDASTSNETILTSKIVTSPTFDIRSNLIFQGSIKTSTSHGQTIETGLTTSVTVGTKTLRFVNGILVEVTG